MGRVVKVGDNAYRAIIYHKDESYSGRNLLLSKEIAENYFSQEKIAAGEVLGYDVTGELSNVTRGFDPVDVVVKVTQARIISTGNVVEKITLDLDFETLALPNGRVLQTVIGSGHPVYFVCLFCAGLPEKNSNVHKVISISGLIFKFGMRSKGIESVFSDAPLVKAD